MLPYSNIILFTYLRSSCPEPFDYTCRFLARLASETFLNGLKVEFLDIVCFTSHGRKLGSISCCTVRLLAFGLSLAMSSSANCIPLIVGFPSSGKARAL